jgi:hypothetical protein
MINENYNNGEDYICNIVNTMNPINTEVPDKEYILQHTKYGWRCISHHPHYIMTNWVKLKDQALIDGDNAIEFYYDKFDPKFNINPEVLRRIEKDLKNDQL